MADSLTTNLSLTKPAPGGSFYTWGLKLNDDLDLLDNLFAASGAGTVVRRDSSNRASTSGVAVSKSAGNDRTVDFLTDDAKRWTVGAEDTAEGGTNAGSNFEIVRHSDAGTPLAAALSINRADGVATFEATPKVGASNLYSAADDAALKVPVGALMPYAGVSAPNANWLLCYGQAISRTTYAALFAAIGTIYGVGDGSTTFNLPDLRGRVAAGKDNMGGVSANRLTSGITGGILSGSTLGSVGGEQSHVLTAAEMPTHTHPATVTDPGHTHPVKHGSALAQGGTGQFTSTGPNTGGALTGTGAATSAITGVSVANANAGGDVAHNNVQPTIVLNWIIRAL